MRCGFTVTAATARAIFGKGMIQPPHESETLGLIAKLSYIAIMVAGYGISAVFTPQNGRFLRIESLR